MSAWGVISVFGCLLCFAGALFCSYKAGVSRGRAEAYRDSANQIRKALERDQERERVRL